MTQNEIFAADMLATENDLPVSFEFPVGSGTFYTAQKGPIISAKEMQEAGYIQQFDFTLEVRLSVFGSTPPAKEKDAIKIGSVTYKIHGATFDQLGIAVSYAVKQSV